jgi:NAD(P)-dependent dehydrogenase (short-subunit alcohol dehydrogenase family)
VRLPTAALPPGLPSLAERVVAITGASSGIGRSLVDLCLGEGAVVAAFARRPVEGVTPGARFLGTRGDVTRVGEAERWLDETERAAGAIDVLINNAGTLHGDLAACFAVNVLAPARLMDRVAPGMARRGRGWIVNITSDLSRLAAPKLAAYAASKAALNSLTQSWAARLAPTGVRVNGLHPGHIKTAMNPLGPDAPETAWPMFLTLVTCAADGPTGRFFGPDGELPWLT